MKTAKKISELNNCIDAHRSAIQMASKRRNLPELVAWLCEEYGSEIPDADLCQERLSCALLQFYPTPPQ